MGQELLTGCLENYREGLPASRTSQEISVSWSGHPGAALKQCGPVCRQVLGSPALGVLPVARFIPTQIDNPEGQTALRTLGCAPLARGL